MRIPFDRIRLYCYLNDHLIDSKPCAVVISFVGLGGNISMRVDDREIDTFYAERGILHVTPYTNPWSWMNKQAVDLTDAVIESIFEHFVLPDGTPVISTGGSMGGLCGIVYTAYAKRTPAACAVNCPVCDLPYHYTERPDLPRTLLSAFGTYDMPLEEAMKTASPLHLVDRLPDIPYYIVHCECDNAVNKQLHSDKFVSLLSREHSVSYSSVPERGHCDLTPEAENDMRAFIVSQALSNR